MKALAYTLLGLALGLVIAAFAFLWWAHQMYTVGMDVNLKAIVVAIIGVILIAVLLFAAWSFLHRKRIR